MSKKHMNQKTQEPKQLFQNEVLHNRHITASSEVVFDSYHKSSAIANIHEDFAN